MRGPTLRSGHRLVGPMVLVVWLGAVAAIAVGLAVWSARGFPQHPAGFATGPLGIAGIAVAGLVYATVGAWLVSRMPRSPMAWVVLGAGAGLAAVILLNQSIESAIHPFRPVPDHAVVLAWISGSLHLPASAAAAVIALLLFPTGRLEWRPMRGAAALAVIGSILLVLGTAWRAGGQLWYPTLPSPVDVPVELGPVGQALSLAGIGLVVPSFALAVAGLAWRYRHGPAEQRHPLAWVIVGGSIMAVTLAVLFVGRYSGLASDADGERLTFLAGLGAIILPLTLVRYFRASAVAGVPVADRTFLFTDLADSASMYQRFGDRPAYDIVRLHFDTIRTVTRAHHGVVVKTIGDAIMATFTRPSDAVATAVAMFDRIDALNEARALDLVLKVGIQRGPAILVGPPDRADYFGQSVNAAARLQAAARAGEICLGDEVLHADGVGEILAGFRVQTETTSLRGVADDVTMHRVVVVAHADDSVGGGQPREATPALSSIDVAGLEAPGR